MHSARHGGNRRGSRGVVGIIQRKIFCQRRFRFMVHLVVKGYASEPLPCNYSLIALSYLNYLAPTSSLVSKLSRSPSDFPIESSFQLGTHRIG